MSRTYLPPPLTRHPTPSSTEMDLPPIRPLGQRYDGSPMPSLRNVAQATGYPLPVPVVHQHTHTDKRKDSDSDDVPPKKKPRRNTATTVPSLPAPSTSHLPTAASPSLPPAPPTTVAPSQTLLSSAPPKRGRKPTHTSRAARDSARKVNHSRIEKRRRERINDALSALRVLVPHEEELARMETGEIGPVRVAAMREDGTLRAGEDEDEEEQGGKKKKAKEFKLEVLDRTVAYVRFLIGQVRERDGHVVRGAASTSGRSMAGPAPTMGLKRKRPAAEDDENDSASDFSGSDDNADEPDSDEEEEGMDDAEHPSHRRRSPSPHPAGPRSPSPYPLLPTPTIHPYRPPPSAVRSSAGTSTQHQAQNTTQHMQMGIDVRKEALLPSPPSSVQQSATISPGAEGDGEYGVPLLALPEPGMALPLPHAHAGTSKSAPPSTYGSYTPTSPSFPSHSDVAWQEHRERERERRRHTISTISPSVIATSASEAEAAAAVLLQLKRDSSVSPTITATASPRLGPTGAAPKGRVAMTPMSVLGMGGVATAGRLGGW